MEISFLQEFKISLFPIYLVCIPSIKVFCDHYFSTITLRCFPPHLELSESSLPCLIVGVVTVNYGISLNSLLKSNSHP